MATTVDELLTALRGGDPGAEEALVEALRSAEAGTILALLADRNPRVRAAAARAAVVRAEPEVHQALEAAGRDPDASVRLALAAAIDAAPAALPDERVRAFLGSDEVALRLASVRAAAGRPALAALLHGVLLDDDDWTCRQAAAKALEGGADPETFLALLQGLAEDDDRDVSRACARAAERFLERDGGGPVGGERIVASVLDAAAGRLKALGEGRHRRLLAWVASRRAADPAGLRRFGTDLTAEAAEGRIPRAFRVDAACDAVVEAVTGERNRAVVLLGPPGSGKTAVVHEVVHRLRERPGGPWRVLRVSPSDFLAGTQFIGEWQTKVRDLVAAASAPSRVVLYVPNLAELSQAGRSWRNDLNVATMLAPHVESGALAVIGESSTQAFRQGLGADASLRRLFAPVELPEATAAETREILRCVREAMGLRISDADLDALIDLAGMYLPGTAQPGRAVGLLRRVADRGAPEGPVGQREVLDTLTESTGIPAGLLDDAVPLDLERTRAFFEARVMGQPEAVRAVLDLVTLVKAGLTDPGRPCGVLLFVGPTGVGKTELARALAELLFGDPGRLLRYDMSEYASPDAYERLMGRGASPGTLTSAIREHPFSVVLLDEIEKAHLNAFDLFLQVFDAGRLTDGEGRTADFRRAIVILTSNLGAAARTEAPIGFGGEAGSVPDGGAILREVHRFFRPEFVNRIDQIVTFRPLALETAEQIARREVGRVVGRSGILRRHLTVDVDPGVIALLLRHGYSPAFGARPLKRTVERLLLLPVARALAHGATAPGSLLRLVARGDAVVVETTPPEEPESPAPRAPARGGARASAAPAGAGATRLAALRPRIAAVERRAAPLAVRKSDLLTRSRTSPFWKDPAAARDALDEVHRLERVVEAAGRAAAEARALEALAAASAAQRRAARLDERIDALAREVARTEALVAAAEANDLGDAWVRITRVKAEGGEVEAVERLATMYEGFAQRRGFEVATLDDRRTGEPLEDSITLLVTGAGAFATLAPEEGLHQFVWKGARGGKTGPRPSRAWVRVDVLRAADLPVAPGEGGPGEGPVRVRTRALRGMKGRRLARPALEVSLLHEPTLVALTAWAEGRREDAVNRLLPLLHALVVRQHDGGAPPTAVVRRYELGTSPRASDRRTHRDTGHVDRVLRGELDLLLPLE